MIRSASSAFSYAPASASCCGICCSLWADARDSACPSCRRKLTTMKSKWTNCLIVTGLMLACGASMQARAQQTLFNVPSSDVLPKAKVYSELDISWKPTDNANNIVQSFSSFVPRIVVGAGGNTEVGLNVIGNIQP